MGRLSKLCLSPLHRVDSVPLWKSVCTWYNLKIKRYIYKYIYIYTVFFYTYIYIYLIYIYTHIHVFFTFTCFMGDVYMSEPFCPTHSWPFFTSRRVIDQSTQPTDPQLSSLGSKPLSGFLVWVAHGLGSTTSRSGENGLLNAFTQPLSKVTVVTT